MRPSLPSASNTTTRPVSPQPELANRVDANGTGRFPQGAIPLLASRGTPQQAAALPPRAALLPRGNTGQSAGALASPAARPDHHVIDIDPPEQQGANIEAAPAAVRPARPAVPPAAAHWISNRTLSRLHYAMAAASTSFSLAENAFPNYGFGSVGMGILTVDLAIVNLMVYRAFREFLQRNANGLRRVELQGQALEQVIKPFCQPDSAAARFHWNASNLFVDTMGRDMSGEVSHMLARAFEASQTSAGSSIAPALRAYADALASSAALRATLANAASEANAQCGDRVGVRLGEIMLAGVMHMSRDPASTANAVVGTLVLHAATRAMESRISEMLNRGRPAHAAPRQPSAELMLFASHAMQAALVRRGMPVPQVFPEHLYGAGDLRSHSEEVVAAAKGIADALRLQPGAEQQTAHAIVDLLRRHGGDPSEQILSTRLAHLIEPVQEASQAELLSLDASKGELTDKKYHDEAQRLQREYNDAVARVWERAIAGALSGNDADWMVPDPSASTAESEPARDQAETSTAAEASLPPSGYDLAKGKWKTS